MGIPLRFVFFFHFRSLTISLHLMTIGQGIKIKLSITKINCRCHYKLQSPIFLSLLKNGLAVRGFPRIYEEGGMRQLGQVWIRCRTDNKNELNFSLKFLVVSPVPVSGI